MPKPVINNSITYQNIHGLVNRHESYLNQGVKFSDSPTFANICLTGNTIVGGNLFVEGNTTILNTNVIEFEDNILLLNRLETGDGVTLNQSGLEVVRGSLENYRIVYNESDTTFKIGKISNLQAVATREDTPMFNGIMTWNNNTRRLDSTNNITIDINFKSTTDTNSTTTGSVIFSGGIGIDKNIWLNNTLYLNGTDGNFSSIYTEKTTNILNITSPSDINLTPGNPSGNINIPFNHSIILGSNTQQIVADSFTKNINISGAGNIDFSLNAGKKITIPNQIPITFSTQNEKIYTDSFNNMVMASGQDITFIPGNNKKVIIPVNVGLAFSNYNQQIYANLSNDMFIAANNNINLNPGSSLNVCIPTDNGIKFGNSGNQRIYSDSNNELYVKSSSDIYLTSNHINIPISIPLTFGNYSQYIKESNGDLLISAQKSISFLNSNLIITNTDDSSNYISTGSIYTYGGLGVSKTIFTNKGVLINSDDVNSLVINKSDIDNSNGNILSVNASDSGNIKVFAGDNFNTSIEITSSSNSISKNIIGFKALFDNTNGYLIGREDRLFTFNLPKYSDYNNIGTYPKFSITNGINETTQELFSVESESGNVLSKGTFTLTNTTNSSNVTTASFVMYGGLSVLKNIISNGSYSTYVNSTQALLVSSLNSGPILNVDTIFNTVTLNSDIVVNNSNGTIFDINGTNNVLTNTLINFITNTTESTDTSSGALIISGGASIQKKLNVSGTLNMNTNKIINVINPTNPKDAATKEYVDLVKQGLYVKDSVQVGTIINGDLNSDFNTNSIIDGYTLQKNNRILIKNQTSKIENGIYIIQDSGPPIRPVDLSDGMSASGIFVFIEGGVLNSSLGWICNSVDGDDIIGINDINFTQFTSLGVINAGDALSKDFNTLNVNVDDSSIEVVNDYLRIKNTVTGTGITGGSGSPLQTITDQSHVTKLGTINKGIWNATTVDVEFGGTGTTTFSTGNILFGNGINNINTDTNLFYDIVNTKLGLGTNTPSENFHIKSKDSTTILLSSDSDGISPNSKSKIVFQCNEIDKSYLGLTRNFNEYSNNTYAESLVLTNDNIIQLSTNNQNRFTILQNGNIGINTSNPNNTLHVIGTLTVTDIVNFTSEEDSSNPTNGAIISNGGMGISKNLHIGGRTRVYDQSPSTSLQNASFIVDGGLSVGSGQNAVGIGNGGGLTVNGGGSFGGDLYVGGSINGSGSSSSTYAYLTLTATDEAINLSTGSLVTFGGITIQATTNSSSLTNGGSLLTLGGASIGSDMYIGGNNYFYGTTNYIRKNTNQIIKFYKNVNQVVYSFDLDNNSNFSLSKYDDSNIFIEKSFEINNIDGSILFYNNLPSNSLTNSSVIFNGGISINATNNSLSLTSGGALTIAGGISVEKNVFIGGNSLFSSTLNSNSTTSGALIISGGIGISGHVNIGGSTLIKQRLTYNNNSFFDVLINNSSNNLWNYFGIIQSSCVIDFTSDNYGLKLIIDITNGYSHNYYGNTKNVVAYIYNETNTSNYHLFVNVSGNSKTNVHVKGSLFNIINEGNLLRPSGFYSGYRITWEEIYTTNNVSNLNYDFGNVTVEGLYFNVADNFPILGYNNTNIDNTTNRYLGISFERYQVSNDIGDGDIVTDSYIFNDSLPNQSTTSNVQIKFSNLIDPIDYTGWWIKVVSGNNNNQVRKIISYNIPQRVAQIDISWTNGNPVLGDIINFYNSHYTSFYYDDSIKSFNLVYNTRSDKQITSYDYTDLCLKHLNLYDTTASINGSTGSIYTLGGISINNTNDSLNCSIGGTFTSLGGASINKTLHVGNKIGISKYDFDIETSLHIKQDISTIKFESDNYSYIDFSKQNDVNRFGILHKDDLLSFTFNNNDSNPFSGNQNALNITSNGYIGINCTSNINSPLTIQTNNMISANDNMGYIGLISAPTNTNNYNLSSRILVYGNNSFINPGIVKICSGSIGDISLCTNNDNERLRVNNNGIIDIFSTVNSKSSTSGALAITGGVGINATENSSSATAGGALTVAGGTSISKDLFVGGNIYVTGNLSSSGATNAPDMFFSNEVNCTFISYANSILLDFSKQGFLSFSLLLLPNTSSENCQIEFDLPSYTTTLDTRCILIGTCTGYTDDENVIPVFNTICIGVKNTNRGLIKFQSVSTGIHYFTIMCRYLMQ